MYLHKDKDIFSEIIEGAAEYYNFDPSHVEKDYWITKVLKDIVWSDYKEQAFFKGGTSLSKAYGIINRFSEDLDIFAYTGDINASKNKEKNLNKKIYDIIINNNNDIYKPKLSKIGGNFRKIYLEYDNNFKKNGLKQQLEVEIKACDFDDKSMIYYPSDKKTINSIVGDYLLAIERKDLIEKYKLNAFDVECINPKKTICDKISRMVKLSYKDDCVNEFAKHIRDLYDVHAILSLDEYKDFLFSEDFLDALYKTTIEDRLMKNSQTNKPLNEAIIFSDTEKILKNPIIIQAYNNNLGELIFKNASMPTLNEIEDTIRQIANRVAKFEEYRHQRMTEEKTVPRPEITKISIYPNQDKTSYSIRCKIDGIQQMGKPLHDEDKNKLLEIIESKDKEAMQIFNKVLAERYFGNVHTVKTEHNNELKR